MNALFLRNQQIDEGQLKDASYAHPASKGTAKPTHSVWVSRASLKLFTQVT